MTEMYSKLRGLLCNLVYKDCIPPSIIAKESMEEFRMTKKRFENVGKDIYQYGEWWCSAYGKICADVITTAMNQLIEENEKLKKELKVYRKIASCENCEHHNYDWFYDGDEFEVCEKGNDVTERICEDWRKL